MPRSEVPLIEVEVTRSSGDDGAILVYVDLPWPASGDDRGPGVRVIVNDDDVFAGRAYIAPTGDPAQSESTRVFLPVPGYLRDLYAKE